MNEWFCTVFPNDLDEMPQDFEALAKVETDYWENPNDYLLEPKDTTFE